MGGEAVAAEWLLHLAVCQHSRELVVSLEAGLQLASTLWRIQARSARDQGLLFSGGHPSFFLAGPVERPGGDPKGCLVVGRAQPCRARWSNLGGGTSGVCRAGPRGCSVWACRFGPMQRGPDGGLAMRHGARWRCSGQDPRFRRTRPGCSRRGGRVSSAALVRGRPVF